MGPLVQKSASGCLATIPSRWTIMAVKLSKMTSFDSTIMGLLHNFSAQVTYAERPYHRNPLVQTKEIVAAVTAAIENNLRVSSKGFLLKLVSNDSY